MLAIRSASLSVVLVVVAFIGNPSGTFRQLVKQPTPPAVNHATPWVALAPRVPDGGLGHYAAFVPGLRHPAFHVINSHSVLVSGGPGRSIDLVLAVALGMFVWRRPQPPIQIVWLAAVVLASRCLFEAVMTPYYLAPPLILTLVLVARKDLGRFGLAVAAAIGTSVYAYLHLNPWVWWLPVVVGLGVIVALGFPSPSSARGYPDQTSPTSVPSALERVEVPDSGRNMLEGAAT